MKSTFTRVALSTLGIAALALAQNDNRPTATKFQVADSERAALQAFWTVDKLANAKPMPLPRVDPLSIRHNANATIPVGGLKASLPGQGPSFSPDLSQQAPAEPLELLNHGDEPEANVSAQPEGFGYVFPFTNYKAPVLNGYPYSAMGKLFFEIPAGASEPAGEYVCSGTVDINNHTILTARHCMFDVSTGKWYSNWIFYPGYVNGPNPAYHNGWTVRSATTWTGGGWDYDIGFLQVNDDRGYGCNGSSGGRPIGAYTGWLGATYNGSYDQRQWDVFGYPQALPFGGARLYQDEAATGVLNPFGTTNIVEVGNPQTGGTSGGAWVIGFDPWSAIDPNPTNNTLPSSINLVNGLNSFKWTQPNQPLAINGPAFMTYNFYNLYTAYLRTPCN